MYFWPDARLYVPQPCVKLMGSAMLPCGRATVCVGSVGAVDTASEQAPVWRANMEELTRRLKHEACVQLANDKHGLRAAAAVAAMLQSSWAQSEQVLCHFCEVLSVLGVQRCDRCSRSQSGETLKM